MWTRVESPFEAKGSGLSTAVFDVIGRFIVRGFEFRVPSSGFIVFVVHRYDLFFVTALPQRL
jgi:hypothetical protein